MFYQKDNLAVAQIPKAGLQTIREWLGPSFKLVPNDEVTAETRVAFIRNPLERLRSCYSFMYWCGDLPVSGWHQFVDHILENDNEHWRPQALIVGDTPNVIHRFERLSVLYHQYNSGVLPWNNRATRLQTDDYRYDDLVRFYRADQRLWDNAV